MCYLVVSLSYLHSFTVSTLCLHLDLSYTAFSSSLNLYSTTLIQLLINIIVVIIIIYVVVVVVVVVNILLNFTNIINHHYLFPGLSSYHFGFYLHNSSL
jgi:hypothetical protein